MKLYDIIVIGAGPAGLFTAINTSKENNKILLLEKKKSPAKKLLISGKGQCNITHEGDIKDFLNHYGDNYRFLRSALYNFDNNKLKEFFNKRGIHFISDDNDKVFPKSLKAQDILDVLLNECKTRGVDLRLDSEVTDIKKEEDIFLVKNKNKTYKSRKVVITTGGCSYQHTGSSGDGYKLAKKLGHTVSKISPALTPVYVKNYAFSDLAGISLNIPISLYRENKKIRSFRGDLLFTHKNLSGPAIINYSRYIQVGDTLKLNFIGVGEDIFRKEFTKDVTQNGQLYVKTVLKKYDIAKRLLESILKISEISDDLKCAQLSKKLRNNLIKNLVSYEAIVERLEGFNLAMVTKGGVSIKEVNSKTMQSKIVEGLYFAGEVLDIDGDTGGYNIQAAFSTAKLLADKLFK
ncbi:NAD(P)/FAD-dependent oxidoreductase [Clostridiaceae bacterium M8S5]|nr:NAD(P)/FAD-dependent oxidoreductase [Clostridiaceae bacterium M8S5]